MAELDFLADEDFYGPLALANAIPEEVLAQGGMGPALGGMVPGFGAPTEPDEMALAFPTDEQAMPDDYWSRLALSGYQFKPPRITRKTSGVGAVVGGLAALLGGYAQARSNRAAREMGDVERENARARENAKYLANRRWQKEQQRRLFEQQKEIAGMQIGARAPVIAPEQRAYQTEVGRRRAATELGETPAEKRARGAAERAVGAQDRANRLAEITSTRQLFDMYRNDKSIQGYQFIHNNLMTARENAKLNTGVGDVTLIFAYGRAREPENPNVLREGEFTVASKAAGQFETLKSLPRRFFTGDKLTDEGRRRVIASIEAIERSRKPAFNQAQGQFKSMARQFGVDPNLFIREVAGLGEATPADVEYVKSLGIKQ